jgi:hypothetical protein
MHKKSSANLSRSEVHENKQKLQSPICLKFKISWEIDSFSKKKHNTRGVNGPEPYGNLEDSMHNSYQATQEISPADGGKVLGERLQVELLDFARSFACANSRTNVTLTSYHKGTLCVDLGGPGLLVLERKQHRPQIRVRCERLRPWRIPSCKGNKICNATYRNNVTLFI